MYEYLQTYLSESPHGINLANNRPKVGGSGEFMKIYIIWDGCDLNHPDLVGQPIEAAHTEPSKEAMGTAIATIIAAKTSGKMTGIAPSIQKMIFVSPTQSGSIAAALKHVLSVEPYNQNHLVLIPEQLVDYNQQQGVNVPCQADEDVRTVLKEFAKREIVVIQAAGDGGLDLASFKDYKNRSIFDPLSADYDPVSNIMVGALTKPELGVQPKLTSFSNFGFDVKGVALGEEVFAGSNNNYGKYPHYEYLQGTAISSAIFAGSILMFKSLALLNTYIQLNNPIFLRSWHQVLGTSFETGVLPDVTKIAKYANGLIDIWSRDHLQDLGRSRTYHSSLQSPDIIVSPKFYSDAGTQYGPDSGTTTVMLPVDIEYGSDNYIYVRVHNNSPNIAHFVEVQVYYSPASTLAYPAKWKPIGDSVFLKNVPPGMHHISPAIVWDANALPKLGHYCFISVLNHSLSDPKPSKLFSVNSSIDFHEYVRSSNNVTWRNFNVIDNNPDNSTHPSKEWNEEPFSIDFFEGEVFEFTVSSDLPRDAILAFELPKEFESYLTVNSYDSQRKGKVIIEINTPCEDITIIKLRAKVGLNHLPLLIQYAVPKDDRGKTYQVNLTQYNRPDVGTSMVEIGRLTWSIEQLNLDGKPD
jgi:serine protease